MLETLGIGDGLGAGDVVLDVVVEEIVALLVAFTTGPEGVAPLVAADLEDAVGVAGLVTGASFLLRIETALALHDADVGADEAAIDVGAHELLGGVALGQNAAGGQV